MSKGAFKLPRSRVMPTVVIDHDVGQVLIPLALPEDWVKLDQGTVISDRAGVSIEPLSTREKTMGNCSGLGRRRNLTHNAYL